MYENSLTTDFLKCTGTTEINGFNTRFGGIEKSGQTSSISSTLILTPSLSGIYQLFVYQECSTAGNGTLDTTITWTDDGGARVGTPAPQIFMNAKNFSQGSIIIRAIKSTDIKYSTTQTGSGTYSIFISLVKLI